MRCIATHVFLYLLHLAFYNRHVVGQCTARPLLTLQFEYVLNAFVCMARIQRGSGDVDDGRPVRSAASVRCAAASGGWQAFKNDIIIVHTNTANACIRY